MLRSPAVRLRTYCAVLGAGILAFGLASCGGGESSLGPDDAAALTIGGVTITNGEIEARAESLAQSQVSQDQQSGTTSDVPAKDSDEYQEYRRAAAEQLRDQQVFAILAKRCGPPCAVTKKEINTQIASIITQSFAGSRADFNAALEAQGMTMADLQEAFRASLQEEKLTKQVTDKVTYSEAQAQAYYTANIDTYRTAAQKRVSHILLGTKEVASALRADLTPDNFAEMAKARSLDPAAKTTGGDLGTLTGSGLLPEMQAAASKLKVGEISQPIQTQFGWSLITVREIPATTKSFGAVKGTIMAEQLQVAQTTATQRWRDTVVRKVQNSAKYLNDRIAPETETTATTTATTATTATTTAAP